MGSMMKRLSFVSCLALACALVGVTCAPGSDRIWNGQNVKPGEFPFVALIKPSWTDSNLDTCGGSVIDEHHILTAASCVNAYGATDHIHVKLGCHELQTCKTVYQVERVMVHHEFKFNATSWNCFSNNVALLRVKGKIVFNRLTGLGAVDKIRIASPNLEEGQQLGDLTTVGWGFTESLQPSGVLQKVQLQGAPHAECEEEVPNFSTNEICSRAEGRGPCLDDHGYPLIKILENGDRVQVGVTSIGLCGLAHDVYAKVSSFNEWIVDCTRGRKCKTL